VRGSNRLLGIHHTSLIVARASLIHGSDIAVCKVKWEEFMDLHPMIKYFDAEHQSSKLADITDRISQAIQVHMVRALTIIHNTII
jgi:hypothetical protein